MLPLASVSALLIVAFPVLMLMVVWTVVTMARILFPESDVLPYEVLISRLEAARHTGKAVPVRARDIVEDLRRMPPCPVSSRVPALPEGTDPDGLDPRALLAADLWKRRN